MKLDLRRVVRSALCLALCSGGIAPAWSQLGAPATIDLSRRFEGYGLRTPSPLAPEPAPTVRKAAYAGLALRQNPEGVVVVAVQPGPFGGDGFKSASIWRGDLIVSMNGQSLDVAGYIKLVRSLSPGDTLRVVYRRSARPDPHAAVPQGDPGGEERSIEIVLDDAAKWRGTIGQGLRPGRVVPSAQAGEFEALILETAEALELRRAPGALDALLGYLSAVQQSLLDPNSLPAVIQALARPLSLDRIEAELASQVRPLAQPQSLQDTLLAAHRLLLRTLDLPDLQSQPDLAHALSAARRDHQQLATRLFESGRDAILRSDPQFPRVLELMRASPELVPLAVAMLPDVARHAMELERFAQEVSTAPQSIPPELVERVRAAVQGPLLGARLIDGELWVVGGDGANRYDMDRIAAVFDLGGPDRYTFSTPARGSYQIIIDQSGDDLYESQGDFAGPAAAVFSVAVLLDRAGNDRYFSRHRGAIAAGLFGVAILIDEAGNDEYLNDTARAGWSQGSGFYGAGVLIDRAGDDRYQAQVLAQGLGGPGGLGLIVDTAGDDIYTANGPHFPSSYDTPGVFTGLSQGVGLGIRGYAAGGLGALYDFDGDDYYSVGEFGQGTGYFQGLGILHDAAGDDWYLGSRYAQGSAAHQAAGLLVDGGGNDSYACPGPAAQGAAWDQSTAMLIDRRGDDTYSASSLAQGAASQQAIGILVDEDGRDMYACASPCLGQSGDNIYHYDAAKLFSFSVLIDRGGMTDAYAQARSNIQSMRTGTLEENRPALSECCGMFLDE